MIAPRLHWVTSLLLCLVPFSSFCFSGAHTTITDATSKFVLSTESTFDHMIELADNLWFHWTDFRDGSFQGRLIHHSDSEEQAPTWLGFGVYHDNEKYQSLPNATSTFMIGSTATIGIVKDADSQTPARTYGLSAQNTEGIIQLSDNKSYSNAYIIQHNRDDGKTMTDLSFTKNIDGDQIGANLRREGVNLFLWAVGPPRGKGIEGIGRHSMKGVISLDFDAVRKAVEESVVPAYSAPNGNESNFSAPVLIGQCGSKLVDGKHSGHVQLVEKIEFHWRLINGRRIEIALLYIGADAWLGVGLSPDGRMVGSSAVIGVADGKDGLGIPPTHFSLNDRDISGLKRGSRVVVEGASILSFATSGDASTATTVLRFTRLLNDPNDSTAITPGLNTFLYAVGASRELSYHEHRGAFQVDLEQCGGSIVAADTWTHQGLFALHGVLATAAWAVATPVAVSVAWFRTLVPTSWIYIHVFANGFTFLATLIAFVVVLVGVSNEATADHFSKTHHWCGLMLSILVLGQVLNGLLRPPLQRKDTSSNPGSSRDNGNNFCPIPRTPRDIWQILHRLSGLTAVVLGMYQIQSGLELYSIQFNTATLEDLFWSYVGCVVLGLLGLRVWLYFYDTESQRVTMQAVFNTDRDESEEDEIIGEENELT